MAAISQLPRTTSITGNSLFIVTENGVSKVVSFDFIKANITGFSGSFGFQGSAGLQGFVGSAGLGYTGSTGPKGDTGSPGGYTGSAGRGLVGYIGSPGFIGRDGYVGSEGPRAYTGSQGPAGEFAGMGYVGSQGTQGNLGYTGSASSVINLSGLSQSIIPSAALAFDIGTTTTFWRTGYFSAVVANYVVDYLGNSLVGGANGYTGSRGGGFVGSAGPQGDPGSPGGYTGSAGTAVAYVGSQGAAGSPGGFMGSRGYIGSQGYAGSTGQGFVGSKGYSGSFGFVGSLGPVGYTGSPGTGGGGVGLTSRQTLSGVTGSLANSATGTFTINGYKSYALLKVQTSAAAWVRIYSSLAAQASDASRTSFTEPLPGSGVIAEIITTAAATQLITPAAIGFNDDSPAASTIYLRVTNQSGSTAAITVTLTTLQLEA